MWNVEFWDLKRKYAPTIQRGIRVRLRSAPRVVTYV